MTAVLALAPILVVGIALVVLRMSAARAMPLAYVVTAGLAAFVWQVPLAQVAAASIKGLMIAAGLLYIIFGAILLLETLRSSGGLTKIRNSFTSITPDRRIQVSSLPGFLGLTSAIRFFLRSDGFS